MQEPTFKVLGTSGADLSQDKLNILKSEKEGALNMMKIASFRDGMQGPYPSPFLNLSDLQIPRRPSEIFRWCKYFYMFDPLIAGAINSLATFPVTDVHLEDTETQDTNVDQESPQLKLYKKTFHKVINIHKLLIEIGVDYHLYGNCFIFGEMYDNPTTGQKEWKHVVRLDPSKMIIDVNPATQEKTYKWQVPDRLMQIIKSKKPVEEYNKIPAIVKDAAIANKAVVIKADNIYHFARPSDSMGESAWGTPVIANVIKLLMYRNVLRQAQEAIAREHIVPFRIYYLDKTDSYNTHGDWNNVAANFANELSKTAKDPNHKVVSPVPVNVITLGGHGRSLLLTPEIEQIQAEILAGMNVPREFIFGGVSFSGSSISLKILENHFITYRLLLRDFMQNFLIKNMAKARGEWEDENDDERLITVRMADLKMQDDVQQKQIIINLNAAGKVSDELVWSALSLDAKRMRESLEKEALHKVELEAKIQVARVQSHIAVQQAQIDAQMQLQMYQAQKQREYMQQTGMQLDGTPVDADADTAAIQAAGGQLPQGSQQPQQPQQPQPPQGPQQPPQQQINIAGIVERLLQVPPAQAQQLISQLPTPEMQATVKKALHAAQAKQEGSGQMDVQSLALQIIKLAPEQRDAVLGKLPVQLRTRVEYMMQQLQPEQQREQANSGKIDMRPMPEVNPPRRDSLK